MHGQMHGQGYCDCKPWESLTKKQKLDMLKEKKKWLDAKSKYLDQAIKQLEKSKSK